MLAQRSTVLSRVLIAAASLPLLIALAACGTEVALPELPDPEGPPGATDPPAEPPSEPGTENPAAQPPGQAELVPDGTAAENLPYFDRVLAEFAANASQQPSSRVAVNTLARAGFEKDDMEVTAQSSRVGNRADSILVSVRLGDDCLIAQFTGLDFVSQLAPVLDAGTCLVGKTVVIDW